MQSSQNLTGIQSAENSDHQDLAQLINHHIQTLENISTQVHANLTASINNFIEKSKSLLNATTKAGASDLTVFKDLECVINAISNPSPNTLLNLHKRINTHQEAASIRTRWGIPSAVSGGLMFGISVITFFTAPVSLPILAAAATTGTIMLASGTGVVVDAKLKRDTLAECEQDILDFVILSLLEKKRYSEFACANLFIFKHDAQMRESNDTRDMILDDVIRQIENTSEMDEIIVCLTVLEDNLKGNSSASNTAPNVSVLINVFNKIKEQADNDNNLSLKNTMTM